MEKPTISNLKQWRADNKLTSEAWNLYASARTDQMNLGMGCALVIGLAVGYFIGSA